MKVLHVIPAYEPAWQVGGGVVRAVSQLCRGLSAQGIDVTVYTTDWGIDKKLGIPVNEPVEIGGVKVIYFHAESARAFRYSRALGEACRDSIADFDLVHIASFWNYPGIPAGLWARRKGIPYVISSHGTLSPFILHKGRLKKWLYMKMIEERNLRGAAAIHFTTEVERKFAEPLGLRVPSFVIPNGLDFREFDELPPREIARAHLGLSEIEFVITFLGALHPCKKLDVLIRGLARLVPRFSKVRLLLAGSDKGQKTLLEKLIRQFGLDHQVNFLGFVGSEKRKQLLAATDLVTLVSSSSENFGYAAVEAMASGVPVLVSDQVGISREIEMDGAGCVVPVDEGAIAEQLERLLTNQALLTDMDRAAYFSVRKRYDIKAVARKMILAYEDILLGRRSDECLWQKASY